MDRKVFIKDNKNKLDEIEAKIAQELMDIERKNKLIQMIHYNNVIKLIEEARRPLYLIQAVNSQFDIDAYLKKYRQYEQNEKTLSQTVRFSIKYDSDMSGIAKRLADSMRVNGFQITTNNKYDAIIKISGSLKKSEAFSMKMVAINFIVTVKTDNNQLVSSKQYNINGSSVSSYAAGENNALNQIKDSFNNKLDLYSMLGLNAH